MRLPCAAEIDGFERCPTDSAIRAADHDEPVLINCGSIMIVQAVGGDQENIAVFNNNRIHSHVFAQIAFAVRHSDVMCTEHSLWHGEAF